MPDINFNAAYDKEEMQAEDSINKLVKDLKKFQQGTQRKLTGTSLPTASASYRGEIFVVLGASTVADVAYVCLKGTNASTYSWSAI